MVGERGEQHLSPPTCLLESNMPIETRYALVTGAAHGIGREIARALARAQWHVGLADLDHTAAIESLGQIEQEGGQGKAFGLDVRDESAWLALRESLAGEWPRLDLVVNAAGVCGAGEIGLYALADWQWMWETNFHGTLLGCHTMLPWLKENARGGHLVNIASIAPIASPPTMGAYNVSKAAVLCLSETLRGELGGTGVGITVVCPGFVPTGLMGRGRFLRPELQTLGENFMQSAFLTAERVASATVRAVERNQFYLFLDWRARLMWRLKRFCPRSFLSLAAYVYRRRVSAVRQKESTTQESSPSSEV